MAFDQIDPADLEGEALKRWYLRSPADIEQERHQAAAQRYQDFFGGDWRDPDPGFDGGYQTDGRDIDPGFDAGYVAPAKDIDPGFTWAPVGPNRLRSVRISGDHAEPFQSPDSPSSFGASNLGLPEHVALGRSLLAFAGTSAGQLGQGAAAAPPNHPATRPAPRPIRVAAGPRQVTNVGLGAGRKPPLVSHANSGNQSQVAYGALRAPAPSDQELAELRRQQGAFANTTRDIDIHNSWFAVPALAPALVALGLGAAGELVTGEVAPEAGQAVANFVERDPYLRVGDNWATRAGRRAHAWLEERLAAKPGWEYEPEVPRTGARPLKPDVGTPQRNPADLAKRYYLELKPNTPTGRAAAARAAKRYFEATGRPARPIYYDPKDFI